MINTIKESLSTVAVAISGALSIQLINLINLSNALQLVGQAIIAVLTIVYLLYKIRNERKK